VRSFFLHHPKSFEEEVSKSTFLVNKLSGTARKWALSLLVDGTLNSLGYKEFKTLLIKNFDGGDDRKQKYVLMDKLWALKQQQLGGVAEYTIEFRKISGRLGWPDEVCVDIIGKGLIDKVREEFDMQEKPRTLFEATNMIMAIDKKYYLESCIRNKRGLFQKRNNKSFNKKKNELNKSENKFKIHNKRENKFKFNKNLKNKNNNEVLSANYIPDKSTTMTTTFIISFNNKNIKINILIDSGLARSFLYKSFVNAHRIPIVGLSSPINVQLPNTKTMMIKQTSKPLKLKFMDHQEVYEFCIGNIQLSGISGILGRDWLSTHNPYIDYKRNRIFFLENYCAKHCPSCVGNKFQFKKQVISAAISEESRLVTKIPETVSTDIIYNLESDICASILNTPVEDNPALEKTIEILKKYYSDLTEIFDERKAEKLPPHPPYDMTIDLVPGSQLYFGPKYSLTVKEMIALKEYIKENPLKGFIRKSKSPAGAPILFVVKKDGTLRLCIDYRRLNAVTVRNSYLIPRINDLLESFKGATIFSRLDLRSAYNLVRIKEGHEYLTAFRTPIGHYEYLVMPFGLRNAPFVFHRFIQDILSETFGIFVQVYLDDIIIYSKDLKS